MRVLVLDDDEDLLHSLGDLVHYTGGQSVLARSLAELTAQEEKALACDLAVLDLNLGKQQPSGIDALRWLREKRFGGRVVFLTGHGTSHPLIVEAHKIGDVRILCKPLDGDELRALVSK
jgi:ActR/RegA family two-component response regulator